MSLTIYSSPATQRPALSLDCDLLARLHLRRSDPRPAIGPRDGEVGASVGLEQYRGAAAGGVRGVGPDGGLVVA